MLGLAEQLVGVFGEKQSLKWSRIYECVNLPMASLERIGQSTLEKAA